jgi:8-hydroxy-5-deazaflavin:NADPH oxidoreductase
MTMFSRRSRSARDRGRLHVLGRPDPKLAIPVAGDDPEALRVAEELVRSIRLWWASSRMPGSSSVGGGHGQQVSAAELEKKLSLTP